MPSRIVVSAFVFITACHVAPTDAPTFTPTDPAPPPIPSHSVARVQLRLDLDNPTIVGSEGTVTVDAFDATGNPVDADGALIWSSNNAVAVLTDTLSVIGRVREFVAGFRLVAPGTAMIRATVHGIQDSVAVGAIEVERDSHAMIVDDFRVLEYKMPCSSTCADLAYLPLLKVRNVSGADAAVVRIEVGIPTRSTGLCWGDVTVPPGGSEDLNTLSGYDWFTSLLLVQNDGTPVPDGLATARLIVRDASGATRQHPCNRSDRPVVPAANTERYGVLDMPAYVIGARLSRS